MRQAYAMGLRAGPAAVVAPWIDRSLPTLDRYRLDPWAHVEDGHVIVPDVVTMQPQIWTPYQHQIEVAEAWLDLDHLRATAKTGKPILRFRNVHEEKSRQMGITWGIAWPMLWAINYHDVALLAIHEHLSELDDGGNAATIDSLFGRIRFMAKGEIEYGETVWPPGMRPLDHLHFRSRPSIIRNTLRPASHIVAEGATPDPARGRKYKAIFLDEAARIPWSEQVNASTRSACPDGRLYNSTPYGTGNTYGRLAKQRPRNFRFLRHHWSEHPLYRVGLHVAGDDPTCKLCQGNNAGERWNPTIPICHRYPGKLTSPWFDNAVLDMTDEQVAQELEIDYSGALSGRVYPEFNDEVHVREHIEYDPALPIITSWDYGVLYTAVGIYQQAIDELRQIGELEVQDAYPEKVVAELVDVLADLGVPLTELEPQFTRTWLGVGDISAEQKQQATGETLAVAYSRLGFTIQSKWRSIDETIRATKRLLQGRPCRYAISADTCPRTIDHWRENTWNTDRAGNISPNAREPKNDEHNHMLRGAAYLFTWLFPPPTVEEALHEASTGVEPGGALEGLMADERDSLDGGQLDYDMGF